MSSGAIPRPSSLTSSRRPSGSRWMLTRTTLFSGENFSAFSTRFLAICPKRCLSVWKPVRSGPLALQVARHRAGDGADDGHHADAIGQVLDLQRNVEGVVRDKLARGLDRDGHRDGEHRAAQLVAVRAFEAKDE